MKDLCQRKRRIAWMDLLPVGIMVGVIGGMTCCLFPTQPGSRDDGAPVASYRAALAPSGTADVNGADQFEIYLESTDGAARIQLTDDPCMRYYAIQATEDGSRIAISAARMAPGTEMPVEEGLYVGEVAFEKGRPARLESLRLLKPMTSRYVCLVFPDWDSSGRLITYSLRAGLPGGPQQSDIYVTNVETGATRNLTRTPGWSESSPAFRPDSDDIVYIRILPARRRDLFLVSARGGTPRPVTTALNSPFQDHVCPEWSPDGEYLQFFGDQRWLSRMPADGSSPPTGVPASERMKRAG